VQPDAGLEAKPAEARTAICMAAFEPDMDLFRAQVDSIRAQADEDWFCIVSDDCSEQHRFAEIEGALGGDQRFKLSRSRRRLGFYRNFERALTMVPASVRYVALADQDDRWHPGKLGTLRQALGSAELVYSDARIVDRDGGLIQARHHRDGGGPPTSLTSLLVLNTVTGAASLFRRELLEDALPFPEVPGTPYHDQWLAAVALARGEIRYVDEPLYDYVQHGAAVLGHSGPPRHNRKHRLPTPMGLRERRPSWREAYVSQWCRLRETARVLIRRCNGELDPRKRRALGLFTRSERSPAVWSWLAARTLRSTLSRSDARAADRALLAGLIWRATASPSDRSSATKVPRPR
jgi:glycosyltransferase involved in cell wall biosynthesis